MFYPEDADTLSWAPDIGDHLGMGDPYYMFLSDMPLEPKRKIFQSINDSIRDHVISDVFGSPEQIRWVAGVLRLGMQLPVEDVDLVHAAFRHYSNIAFQIHQKASRPADGALSGKTVSASTMNAVLELMVRPAILFNPRVFFAYQLPSVAARGHDGRVDCRMHAPFVVEPAACRAGPALLHGPIPRLELLELDTNGGDQSAALEMPRVALSASAVDRLELHDRAGLGAPVCPPLSATQLKRALGLWEQHVAFLEHVLLVYTTIFRGPRHSIGMDRLEAIIRSTMCVIDMILSQGGNNPRLAAWRDRYRPIVGAELWDRTWGTLGDRLEAQAVKLMLDVWSRTSWQAFAPIRSDVHKIQYWTHRDRVIDAWMAVIKEVFRSTMWHCYIHGKGSCQERVRVQLPDFSIVLSLMGVETLNILEEFSRIPVEYGIMSDHGYAAFAGMICDAVDDALSIKRTVVVNGLQYAQMPPTPNSILGFFGKKLIAMAKRKQDPAGRLVGVRRRVIETLVTLLIMPQDPEDPLQPEYRSQILYAVRKAMDDPDGPQVITPNVAALLINTRYARPFIPKIYTLLSQVLPMGTDSSLRRSGYEAIAAIVGLISYYQQLGQLDLIGNSEAWLTNHLSQNERAVESARSMRTRTALRKLAGRIARCTFKGAAKSDPVFRRYLRCIFQDLLISAALETSAENLQYATCVAITLLHQHARYAPGYVGVFVEFYVDQLGATQSDELSTAYVYGILQAAMVTWEDILDEKECAQIVDIVVSGLSDCDRGLRMHTSWHPYHQTFITSMRCLSSWISVLGKHVRPLPETSSKLVALVARCNAFMSRASHTVHEQTCALERRLCLPTSEIEDVCACVCGNDCNTQAVARRCVMGCKTITTFTLLDVFGTSGRRVSARARVRASGRPIILDESLYKTLFTTIGVLSVIFSRRLGAMTHYHMGAPVDIQAAHRILGNEPTLNARDILRNCRVDIVDDPGEYVPVRLQMVAMFNSIIYTAITIRRRTNQSEGNLMIHMTARHAGGRREWVHAFPPLKRTETAVPEADPEQPPLPWIRKSECEVPTASGACRAASPMPPERVPFVGSAVDEESDQAISRAIASSYNMLHEEKYRSDVQFQPARPHAQAPKGATLDRRMCASFFGSNFNCIDISESVLKELDLLDDLDMPFSAHAGIIYLQSPDSLTTRREVCKGPLRGVSSAFSRFLEGLCSTQRLGVGKLCDHQYGRLSLLRRVFSVKGFKVCYDLAPNVSSLVSGRQMGPDDNARFYELLKERGITVVWFDLHPGPLNAELTWQFIDQLQHGASDQQHAPGAEYPLDAPQHRTTVSQPASTGEHNEEAGQQSLASSASVLTETKEEVAQNKDADVDAARIRQELALDNKVLRCSSHPCRVLAATMRRRKGCDRPRAEDSPAVAASPSGGGDTRCSTPPSMPERQQSSTRGAEDGPTASYPATPANTPVDPLLEPQKPPDGEPHQKAPCCGPCQKPDKCMDMGCSATRAPDVNGRRVRVLLALAPIVDTAGRLIKVTVSVDGGPKELNQDFERMTGPLTTHTVVAAKDIACVLSATVLDASANMASLQGDDFSMVYRRAAMISDIIERHSIKHGSISDAHKFVFPSDKSGMRSAVDARHGTSARDRSAPEAATRARCGDGAET
ncbi:hypothetical protein H4R18_001735 [Coemansia javaensis]|uniref:Rap-GAP domain-containing protein n=1 Tax=Coemansia javaensis TaxID=2761396 RepID=A0A9W8HE27_9FUNG|nr:hypothetical protein H4R18_001735 [Coemansia javaensis]